MPNDIILSIKPKYAEMIFQGTKMVELRKSLPKEMPGKVYLYATKPVGRIVGWLIPNDVYRVRYKDKASLLEAAYYFQKKSGLSEEEFMSYGCNKKLKVLKFKEVYRCDRPLPRGIKPPRNFVYLKEPCASCLCWDFPGCEACLKIKETV